MRDLALLEVSIDVQILSTRLNQIPASRRGLVYLLDIEQDYSALFPYSTRLTMKRFREAHLEAFIDRNKHMVISAHPHGGVAGGGRCPQHGRFWRPAPRCAYVMAINAVAIAAVLLLAFIFPHTYRGPVIHISRVMNRVGRIWTSYRFFARPGDESPVPSFQLPLMDMIRGHNPGYTWQIREKQSGWQQRFSADQSPFLL